MEMCSVTESLYESMCINTTTRSQASRVADLAIGLTITHAERTQTPHRVYYCRCRVLDVGFWAQLFVCHICHNIILCVSFRVAIGVGPTTYSWIGDFFSQNALDDTSEYLRMDRYNGR